MNASISITIFTERLHMERVANEIAIKTELKLEFLYIFVALKQLDVYFFIELGFGVVNDLYILHRLSFHLLSDTPFESSILLL